MFTANVPLILMFVSGAVVTADGGGGGDADALYSCVEFLFHSKVENR